MDCPEGMVADPEGGMCACKSTCEGSLEYTFKFEGNWNQDDHPLNFPVGEEHFSSVVVAAHNDMYSLFKEGAMASAGLEAFTELGFPEVLNEELRDDNHVMSFS